MRSKILLAVILSAILIGMASWQRFAKTEPSPAELKYVENITGGDKWNNFLNQGDLASTTSSVDLTSSDIVGRSLLSDYINMAVGGGGVSNSSLDGLVNNYIENIPKLISSKTVSVQELKVIPTDTTSLKKYSDETSKVYTNYVNKIALAYSSQKPTSSSENRAEFASYTYPVYEEYAAALKNIQIPSVIADKHLELVNIALSNTEASKALQNIAGDAATGFAGLVKLGENFDRELVVIQEIGRILTSNGL